MQNEKPNESRPDKVQANNLAAWLESPLADQYFSSAFVFKFAVLAHIVSGSPGTLADLARRHGKSQQAASKHAVAAKRIFGLDTTKGG